MLRIMARNPDMIGPEEIAAMLGVDPKTVNRWGGKNGFPQPTRTPGNHRRWHRADILAYISDHRDGKRTA